MVMLRCASVSLQFSRELAFFKSNSCGAVCSSRETRLGLQLFPVSTTSQTGLILENADPYVDLFIILFLSLDDLALLLKTFIRLSVLMTV